MIITIIYTKWIPSIYTRVCYWLRIWNVFSQPSRTGRAHMPSHGCVRVWFLGVSPSGPRYPTKICPCVSIPTPGHFSSVTNPCLARFPSGLLLCPKDLSLERLVFFTIPSSSESVFLLTRPSSLSKKSGHQYLRHFIKPKTMTQSCDEQCACPRYLLPWSYTLEFWDWLSP